MKKMPCLFVRDFSNPRAPTITEAVTPGCEWVLNGEGRATRKWDGTACAVIGGKLFARYDSKHGKPAPVDGIPCSEPDPVTGHWPHWVPVLDQPQFKWHREGWSLLSAPLDDGTYELCGPKINTNPEYFDVHTFVRHGSTEVSRITLTFEGLRSRLEGFFGEGIVWHHVDGRMCKLRRDDFGFPWPLKP